MAGKSALEIRSIPKIWPDSTIIIIGGGPSVKKIDIDLLWKHRTIGVNHAISLGPVDMLWFGDFNFYKSNELKINAFAGLKCTCACEIPELDWPAMKRVRRAEKIWGIESERADAVAWNNNSGGSAINIAYHLGAKRIALVGFDMRRIGSATHFHDFYGKRSKEKDPYIRHMKCFDSIAEDANKLGLEIVNCTPGSKITQFQFVKLESL